MCYLMIEIYRLSLKIFCAPRHGTYQYVPAPWEVRSIPHSGLYDSSSIILLNPKSVILISPLSEPKKIHYVYSTLMLDIL